MGPIDRRSEGLLAGVGISSALQQVEALGEPFEDLLRRERTRPGRGELEREREVVERSAEFMNGFVGLALRACREQRDRLRLGERQDRVLDLAPDAQQFAACDQQLEIGASLDE